MSKGNPKTPNLVIEWSPKGVTTFDAVTHKTQHYESVQAASAVTGGKEVVVAVSRRSVFVRTTRVPDAAIADIRLVLSMKLGDLFPLAASDLAYDFVLADDVNADGRLAIVAAMSAQDLRKLHEEFRAAGYKIAQVVPSAFGAVALAGKIGKSAAAIVSREADGIGIDIIEGGQLRYSRLSTNTANPVAEVCRTYTVAGLAVASIVAAGGLKFADSDVTTAEGSLDALISSPAGLTTVNLELPEAVALRAKKIRDQRQAMALFMFVAALGLSGFAYYDHSSKQAILDREKSKDSAELTKYTKLQKVAAGDLGKILSPDSVAALTGAKAPSKTAGGAPGEDAQSNINLAFSNGQRFSDVATLVSNNVPDGLWLTGISLERGKRLVLRGTAKTNELVEQYARTLNTLDANTPQQRLRDVKLEFTNPGSIEQIPVVQFSISAFPIGNVPLFDQTKVKVK